jgi:predicted metalloprotease
MRWSGRRQSGNIEDRRGLRAGGLAGGGLLALIVIVYALFTGQDPSRLLEQLPPASADSTVERGPIDPAQAPLRDFVAVVLADTEDVWGDLFPREFGQPYEQPRLVLFSGRVDSACGLASAAVGPFYCPGDHKAYLDLEFFGALHDELGAPGDFAMAYVIAHEIGHHVQNLVGLADEVQRASSQLDEAQANALSVRLELQADYLAGVWAHHAQRTKDILESGDVEEALQAANAIGDDALQKQSQGYVVPDSFTHGTSQQRLRWFQRGLQTGDVPAMQQLFELPYEQL